MLVRVSKSFILASLLLSWSSFASEKEAVQAISEDQTAQVAPEGPGEAPPICLIQIPNEEETHCLAESQGLLIDGSWVLTVGHPVQKAALKLAPLKKAQPHIKARVSCEGQVFYNAKWTVHKYLDLAIVPINQGGKLSNLNSFFLDPEQLDSSQSCFLPLVRGQKVKWVKTEAPQIYMNDALEENLEGLRPALRAHFDRIQNLGVVDFIPEVQEGDSGTPLLCKNKAGESRWIGELVGFFRSKSDRKQKTSKLETNHPNGSFFILFEPNKKWISTVTSSKFKSEVQ